MAQGRSTKIISMIKWIRIGRLSIKSSLSESPFPNPKTSRFKPVGNSDVESKRVVTEFTTGC